MLYSRNALDQIINTIDLIEYGRDHGMEIGGNNKARCLWHLETTPSLQMHSNWAYCFACCRRFDIYDFGMKLTGQDFKEVVSALARRVGISPANDSPSLKQITPKNHARQKTIEECICEKNFKIRLACALHMHTYLSSHLQKTREIPCHIKPWIKLRGFDEDLLLDYALSTSSMHFIDNNMVSLNRYVKKNVHSFLDSGIFNKKGNISFASNYYGATFPIHTMCNGFLLLVSFAFRKTSLLESDSPKEGQLPTSSDCPGSFGFMGLAYAAKKFPEQVRDGFRGLKIVLCESPMDMLAWMHLYPNEQNTVVLATTLYNALKTHNLLTIKNADLSLAFDHDEEGENGVYEVTKSAREIGIEHVERFEFPEEFKDLNDYLIGMNNAGRTKG